jgi:predicted TIM-barrel fold metal-dependent hydrolase
MSSSKVYEELLDTIRELEIIDTHEHLPGKESDRNREADLLQEYLIHYFSCDLVSAGLSPADLEQARNTRRPLMERWERVGPYWELARNTGYGRALDESAEALYGLGPINRENLEELNRRFRKALEKGGHYHYVLKEKSRIQTSIIDTSPDCDRTFFRSTYRFDHIIMVDRHTEVVRLGREAGIEVHSLEDWKKAIEKILDQGIEKGVVSAKIGVAYLRSLRFDKVSTARAEEAFYTLFDDNHIADWHGGGWPGKALQDYTMHFICALCESRGLPLQIHTGLQEGNGNIIYHSDPALLSNLFNEYTGAQFDLFHIGYPYQQTLSALAKNFQNVFIDMCWAHIISAEACVRALVEWLDAVPINKISAFGGDYCFVDGVYGHQKIARENVARALAKKVRQGVFGPDRAKEIARRLFIENPATLFKLK